MIVNLTRQNMEVIFDNEDLTHLNEGYENLAIESADHEQEQETDKKAVEVLLHFDFRQESVYWTPWNKDPIGKQC